MRMRDVTQKQFSSVPCPTCSVFPGQRCLLSSGGLRSEPHVDRKLAAMEALEQQKLARTRATGSRSV